MHTCSVHKIANTRKNTNESTRVKQLKTVNKSL